MRPSKDVFKDTIEAELKRRAKEDPFFAENLKKEGKDIDNCVGFILQTVKEMTSGQEPIGLTDDQVFNLAAHYYDEDDITKADLSGIRAEIVINKPVELTEEEIAEVRDQAKKELLQKEKLKRTKKSSTPAPEKKESQASLF